MKKLIALLFISASVFATGGAPPVQDKIDGGTGSTLSTAFDVGTTAGNTLYVAVGMADTTWTMTSGPSDSCGDTFTEAANSPVTSSGARIRIYTAPTSGGCSTITLGTSVSAAYNVYLAEYNNIDTSSVVDCTSSGTGNSTSLATGNCVSSVANTTLVSFGFQPVNNATYTAGSSYTIEEQNGGTGHSCAAEDRNVTSAGTYTGTMTSDTSGDWAIHVLALKSADQSTPAASVTPTGIVTFR
jgi:hypothetical protein